MAGAQGNNKELSYKKQVAKGTPAIGASAQKLRRETASFSKKNATYTSNEITAHRQYVGDTHGVASSDGALSGLLSPKTYVDMFAALMRSVFAAVTAITGMSLTIAGAGPTFTITRAAGDFLAGGIKRGHVVRITAGTYTGVARDINLLVLGVTATVLTVAVLNGKTLSAQGPITGSTITVVGKTAIATTTGQTNDYFTFEEWFTDLTRSRLYPDVKVTKADVGLPASGNGTIALTFMGLGGRTKTNTRQHTSPTDETSTPILAAVNGYMMVGANRLQILTGATMSIDLQSAAGEAVMGSNTVDDIVVNDLKISGQVTALFDSETLSDIFDSQLPTSIIFVITSDPSDTADFMTFVVPRTKLFGDDIDDGKKQVVATYPFTAEINNAGGTALESDRTIFAMQDSAA